MAVRLALVVAVAVLVAAVPPIGPEARTGRDPAAVAAYTAILERLCARHGCRVFDPFAELRDGEPGLTTLAVPPVVLAIVVDNGVAGMIQYFEEDDEEFGPEEAADELLLRLVSSPPREASADFAEPPAPQTLDAQGWRWSA